jgi:glutaconate CoA-transferase subunit B
VTGLGVYRFDEQSGEMVLAGLHPGITLDEVHQSSGWDMRVADDLRQTPPPSDEELRLIREELDPGGTYTR